MKKWMLMIIVNIKSPKSIKLDKNLTSKLSKIEYKTSSDSKFHIQQSFAVDMQGLAGLLH